MPISLTSCLRSPVKVYDGANRYDTDTEHVLHLWADGESFDIVLPKEPQPCLGPPA